MLPGFSFPPMAGRLLLVAWDAWRNEKRWVYCISYSKESHHESSNYITSINSHFAEYNSTQLSNSIIIHVAWNWLKRLSQNLCCGAVKRDGGDSVDCWVVFCSLSNLFPSAFLLIDRLFGPPENYCGRIRHEFPSQLSRSLPVDLSANKGDKAWQTGCQSAESYQPDLWCLQKQQVSSSSPDEILLSAVWPEDDMSILFEPYCGWFSPI